LNLILYHYKPRYTEQLARTRSICPVSTTRPQKQVNCTVLWQMSL